MCRGTNQCSAPRLFVRSSLRPFRFVIVMWYDVTWFVPGWDEVISMFLTWGLVRQCDWLSCDMWLDLLWRDVMGCYVVVTRYGRAMWWVGRDVLSHKKTTLRQSANNELQCKMHKKEAFALWGNLMAQRFHLNDCNARRNTRTTK